MNRKKFFGRWVPLTLLDQKRNFTVCPRTVCSCLLKFTEQLHFVAVCETTECMNEVQIKKSIISIKVAQKRIFKKFVRQPFEKTAFHSKQLKT